MGQLEQRLDIFKTIMWTASLFQFELQEFSFPVFSRIGDLSDFDTVNEYNEVFKNLEITLSHLKKAFNQKQRMRGKLCQPYVLLLSKNVPLVSTSSRKFKTCQPEELQLFNILPLMEVCSSLLGTSMEIFTDTRQAPWFTRWMNRLKNSYCTRPCKLEVPMVFSTFLSLINISLLWLVIGIIRTNLTLSSSGGMDSSLWYFRNYQQKELHTSSSSR